MDSTNRQPLSCPFSEQQLREILLSNEGQQLLKFLNQDGGATLNQAANAAKKGDFAKALDILKPMTSSSEASRLVTALEKKHG